MIQLYGRPNTGSLAVQIVLEEIGEPYELRWVERTPEALAEYRRINPAGKVPALMLPDGTAVCESAAILTFLASAYPAAHLAPAPGSGAHARFLQWMVFLSANVYETVLRYSYPERYSTAGAAVQAGIQERAVQDHMRHLESVHATLAPYVLGTDYSAADPYLYMLTRWYPGDMTALHERLPRLARHSALVRERAATIKADADHDEKAPST
jgi:glutathione S-transferase